MTQAEKVKIKASIAENVLHSILNKCNQLQYSYRGTQNILDEHIYLSKKIANEMFDAIVESESAATESNEYEIGQSVYLKTDKQQHERIITGILIRSTGVTYSLSFESSESWHYDFEFTPERDIIKATTN